jgi:hypothetical protein
VVRDFQHADACRRESRRNLTFNLRTDISREQHRHVAARHFEHHRIIVTNARTFPVGFPRVQDADARTTPGKRFACTARRHRDADRYGVLTHMSRRFVARNNDALP